MSAVDQQHLQVLAQLEHGGEIRRDRRLADAALRVEHGEDRRLGHPVGRPGCRRRARRRRSLPSGAWTRIAIASRRQRSGLDAPRAQDDLVGIEARCLEPVELVLVGGVDDRQGVRPAAGGPRGPARRHRRGRPRCRRRPRWSGHRRREGLGDRGARRQRDRVEAGLGHRLRRPRALRLGERDDDRRAVRFGAHGRGGSHQAAGSCASTVKPSFVASVICAAKPARLGDAGVEIDAGIVTDREHEHALLAGRHAHGANAGESAARAPLKAEIPATLVRPLTRRRVASGPFASALGVRRAHPGLPPRARRSATLARRTGRAPRSPRPPPRLPRRPAGRPRARP